ncbi:MAG: two-component regulator propeller domain-containing protein, partial [Flavisolibacter sp.]
MRICLLIALAVFQIFQADCQNTIGLPDITNYNKKKYGGGTQNWDIKKDKNGILYFANNEGLLTFDGSYWKIHPLPNKSIVRSVEISEDNKVYVGGQEELGYFYPDKNGSLVYTSLKPLIPKDQVSFADVWDVIAFENQVFFRSNRKIFQYAYERITVFSSVDWRFMGLSNGRLVAQDYQRDLLTFRDGVWMPFIKSSSLTGDFFIRASVDIGIDSTLIATKNGIFLLNKDKILPFKTHDLNIIDEKKVYAAAKLDTDRFALVTNLGGCYIINSKGELVQRLAKEDGIQNNNILSVYVDQQKNLWLGLDNGIDFVSYGSALKKIAPNPLNKYSGYASIIYNNELYLGTSAGAFKARLSPSKDISFVRSDFVEVKNTKGQVWSFANINGKLLMGHNDGAFTIQNNTAIPFDPTSGFWTFQPLFNVLPSSKLIAGSYNGINIYDYKNGN